MNQKNIKPISLRFVLLKFSILETDIVDIFFSATPRTSSVSGFHGVSKEKGNQSLPIFRIVFKLSQVPSVARRKGPIYYKHLLTRENILTLCVCYLFLLVVGHSPAGEHHCGEGGESQTVSRVAGQGEAGPLCYLP